MGPHAAIRIGGCRAGDRSTSVIQVLAVDDDEFARLLLQRVLAAAGMQVTSHGSAAELLAAGDLASADVLLLDMKMPGMSGLELQDVLRRRGIDLPLVFISGAADLAMAVTGCATAPPTSSRNRSKGRHSSNVCARRSPAQAAARRRRSAARIRWCRPASRP
jgi:CheY-like chemotaxis protein